MNENELEELLLELNEYGENDDVSINVSELRTLIQMAQRSLEN